MDFYVGTSGYSYKQWKGGFYPEDLLRSRHAALCVAQAEGQLEVPLVATADWGYLRPRNKDYADAQLKAWQARLAPLAWHDVFVFFKHEEEACGPQLARRFMESAETGPAGRPAARERVETTRRP
jgi:uncharacterized protein YecE (DUF72 family)